MFALLESLPSVLEGPVKEVRRWGPLRRRRKRVAAIRSNFLLVARELEDLKSSRLVLVNLQGATVERSRHNGVTVSYVGSKGLVETLTLLCPSEAAQKQWLKALARQSRTCPISTDAFEPLFVLGKGHFGRVELARHKPSGALVALKELREEKDVQARASKKRGKRTLAQLRLDKQVSERVLLGQLTGNPFVSRLAFAFREQGKLFLATEFSARGDLWTLIRARKRVGLDAARDLVSQTVAALDTLHARGIVHRDIKLENLMLDHEGRLKLIDLGLAKMLPERRSSTPENRRFGFTFSMCGTSYYFPPEMIRGVGHGLAADWWQLGCLLYELLVGRPAFFEKDSKRVQRRILSMEGPDMDVLRTHIGASTAAMDTVDIIEALLTHEPADRLGATGSQRLRKHRFFDQVDWAAVDARTSKPAEEIAAYVAVDGLPHDAVDRTTVARFFRDAKTLDGENLNRKLKEHATPSEELRGNPARGSDSSAKRGTSESSATSSSSASTTVTYKRFSAYSGKGVSSSEDGGAGWDCGCEAPQGQPRLPNRSEPLGPLLGYHFQADLADLDAMDVDLALATFETVKS